MTCDGENVKSGVFAISHARAIAGNEALLRLSEIWQKTSIPDWQRLRAASLTSDGPLTGRLTSSSPSLLSASSNRCRARTELTSPGVKRVPTRRASGKTSRIVRAIAA